MMNDGDLLEELPSDRENVYEKLVFEDTCALVEDRQGNVEQIPHPDLHVLEDGAGWGVRRLSVVALLVSLGAGLGSGRRRRPRRRSPSC